MTNFLNKCSCSW